ncbi:hypothetical protein FH5_01288 [Priestia endophytica]|nr:hypothetical protein FH5_01288 [Priestia endophytica]
MILWKQIEKSPQGRGNFFVDFFMKNYLIKGTRVAQEK